MTRAWSGRRRLGGGIVATLIVASGCATDGRAPVSIDIEVGGVYVAEPALEDRTAMYLSISNGGDADDELLAVSTELAGSAEIHRTVSSGEVMKMEPVETVRVPAGGDLRMEPGGYHVMLLDLRRELRPGERVDVMLRFKNAGEIQVRAEVLSYADLEEALSTSDGSGRGSR